MYSMHYAVVPPPCKARQMLGAGLLTYTQDVKGLGVDMGDWVYSTPYIYIIPVLHMYSMNV
jgi:hypothetical protein